MAAVVRLPSLSVLKTIFQTEQNLPTLRASPFVGGGARSESMVAGGLSADHFPSERERSGRNREGERWRCQSFRRSGLSRSVRSMACSISHCAIRASCPERRMSGTFHPLYSAGRVYTGGSSRLSWKESESALCSSPMTPGTMRAMASVMHAAASSPPVST